MAPTNTDSSSNSSQRFDLDVSDTKPILVYKVREGCHICTQKGLCDRLDQDPTAFRCSRIPIPLGASRVHVQTKDLWNEEERKKYERLPNASLSVASVGLPRKVYWKRMMGQFPCLYIVSPDHSPASSENSSPGNSQRPSPASTFDVNEDQN